MNVTQSRIDDARNVLIRIASGDKPSTVALTPLWALINAAESDLNSATNTKSLQQTLDENWQTHMGTQPEKK